jgi:hypothetical protein
VVVKVIYTYASKTQMMVETFPPKVWDSVLDIGCGDKDLREYCMEYIGVDIREDADMVGEFPYMDIRTRPTTVVLSHVLEHLDDIRLAVNRACQIAGRWVVVVVPNPFSLRKRVEFLCGKATKYMLPVDDVGMRCVYHRWLYGLEEFRRFMKTFDWQVTQESVIVPKRYRVLGEWARKRPGLFGMHYMCLVDKDAWCSAG